MATQTQLLPQSFHLDRRSREAGRRGVAKARQALAQAQQRTHRPSSEPPQDPHHATAA